jgi:hypothetical protein
LTAGIFQKTIRDYSEKNKIDDLPKSLKPVPPAKLVPAKAGSRSPELIDFTGFPLPRE